MVIVHAYLHDRWQKSLRSAAGKFVPGTRVTAPTRLIPEGAILARPLGPWPACLDSLCLAITLWSLVVRGNRRGRLDDLGVPCHHHLEAVV